VLVYGDLHEGQLGIWVPSQGLLRDYVIPRENLIELAGRRSSNA
jgi:hypothetical protein